jgi:hypothetical protein
MSDDAERETTNVNGWTKRLWLHVRRSVPFRMRHDKTDETDTIKLFEETINTLALAVVPSGCPQRNNKYDRVVIPNQIPHVRQQETWDCGIACLEMAVQWLQITGSNNHVDRNAMLKLADTQSIWTIDLVWILQHIQNTPQNEPPPHDCSFRYLFCSKRFEASDEWSHMNYYQAAFPTDKERVSYRFREARHQNQASMIEISLSMPQFLNVIRDPRWIAIALVDMNVLRGKTPNSNTPVPNQNDDETTKTSSYIGHYVLISGTCCDPDAIHQAHMNYTESSSLSSFSSEYFSVFKNEVLAVLDPGVDQSVCFYTFGHFEQAWKAQGTDHDVIFIVHVS